MASCGSSHRDLASGGLPRRPHSRPHLGSFRRPAGSMVTRTPPWLRIEAALVPPTGTSTYAVLGRTADAAENDENLTPAGQARHERVSYGPAIHLICLIYPPCGRT